MFHEILSPEQEAAITAWWRQAFLALDDLISDAAEGDDPSRGSELRASPGMEKPAQSEAGRTVTGM